MTAAPPERVRGTVVGSYALVERIGGGGMGEVWKARDRLLDRLLIVAVGLVALIPKRDATVPPGRATGIIELAIPGLAASWRWAAFSSC